MNQNNKKIKDEFGIEDVSDNNISYVNGKNATTNSNNEFVINDLSFEDFKLDAKLEGGNATLKSDNSSSEKVSDSNNTSSEQASDSKDTNVPSNANNSNSDTSNDNDMKDVSDEMLENDNNKSDSSNSSNEGDSSDDSSSDENKEGQDNKGDDLEDNQDDKDKKDEKDGKSDENKDDSDSKENKEDSDSKENKDDSDNKENKEDSDSKENKEDSDGKENKDESDSKENKDDKDSDKKEDDKDKEKDKKDEPNDKDKVKKHDGLDDKDKNDPNKKDNNKKDNNNSNNNNKENQNKNSNNSSDNGSKNNSRSPDNNPSNNGNKENTKKNNNDKKKSGNDKKPNPYQRKKDDLKKKWDNRPKTPKDFAKRAGNGIKNKAKDAVNNSAPGRAVNKAKETVQKTKEAVEKTKKVVKHIIKYWKVYVIGIGVLGLVFAIIIFCSLTATGINGNVNNEGTTEKYSDQDQKTLAKLKELFGKYPSADGAVAMATIALPYYDPLIDSSVKSFLEIDTQETDDSNVNPDDTEEDDDQNDNEDIEDSNVVSDDPYLAIFRKSKVRKRLKNALKELEKGEESYKTWLKDSYIGHKKDTVYGLNKPYYISGYNGYHGMFKDIKSQYKDKEDELREQIIDNIYSIKDLFSYYVYESSGCVANLIDAGSISTAELLKGNVLVDLRKPGCSNIGSCTESYYDHYLTLEEYVKGVVYEEIGTSTDVDVLAAQMVAAKTYTLSRRSPKKDPTSGAYVMTMLWSTADQDFCHTEKGCNSSDITPYYGYNTGGDDRLMHGANRGPLSDKQKALYDSAWNKSKNTYILDKNGNPANVSYWQGSGCNPGNCMEQSALEAMTNTGDYNIILSRFYTNFSLATVEGDSTNIQQVGAPVCTGNTQNLAAKRNKVVSFANSYVKKIPYDKDKLAKTSGFEGNNFGIETREVAGTPTEFKTGLGVVGFVNWVYWSTIDENFGNTNDIQKIISSSFEITKDKLLLGDIGYSADKSLVAIYAGDEKWIYEDPITNNVIIQPSDKFTKFIRLNSFKDEIYDYPIRTKRPTPTEWNMNDTSKWAYYANEFIGECPWFARNRAAEIINGLYDSGSLTKAKYKTLISRVVCCYGDGGQFFPGGSADGGCGTKKFKGSTNIKDIKTGSFLSKASGSQWGHVMVVEYANPQENKIILSDGYNKPGMDDMCTKTNFDCGVMNFNTQYTYEQFYNEYGSTFKGYLYFLEE